MTDHAVPTYASFVRAAVKHFYLEGEDTSVCGNAHRGDKHPWSGGRGREATCPECNASMPYDTSFRVHSDEEPPTLGQILGATGSLRKDAHDTGDGVVVNHCCFCGSGQVIARSDGNIECQFCGQAFIVRLQPMFSAYPQTIDGQPVQVPGMPPRTPDMGQDQVGPDDAAPEGQFSPGQEPDDGDDGQDEQEGDGRDGPLFGKQSGLRFLAGIID